MLLNIQTKVYGWKVKPQYADNRRTGFQFEQKLTNKFIHL